MSRVLVTGAAGFIGFHLCKRFLAEDLMVVGVDSLNEYYDTALKHHRLEQLVGHSSFKFEKINLADRDDTENCFARHQFDLVLHMAAQAGVRYSIDNPHAYAESNLIGFLNVLEGCRHSNVKHLVYASSSSVYGNNQKSPSSVEDFVDHPISFYAATKKSNELMAHVYSHLYRVPTTGLRFFTVYGPWGRPDMAIYKFTESIFRGQPIDVYNHGKMKRSFTYIDDVVEGVFRIASRIPSSESVDGYDEGCHGALPYRVFNIGNDQSVELEIVISLVETALGKKAVRNYLPMQLGDVKNTCADIQDLNSAVGFAPITPLHDGIPRFVDWYRCYVGS